MDIHIHETIELVDVETDNAFVLGLVFGHSSIVEKNIQTSVTRNGGIS